MQHNENKGLMCGVILHCKKIYEIPGFVLTKPSQNSDWVNIPGKFGKRNPGWGREYR